MQNYIQGEWRPSSATETLPVINPATGEELDRTPLSSAADIDQAAQAAARAFPEWRRVPVTERVQFLFSLKALLEEHFDDLSRTITMVMPDADITSTSEIVADSAFGCAGQRCLASSFAVAVGDAARTFGEAIRERAATRVTGYGLDEAVQMGPVISPESRARIESLIEESVAEGARAVVDGRRPEIPKYPRGNFVRPTIIEACRSRARSHGRRSSVRCCRSTTPRTSTRQWRS